MQVWRKGREVIALLERKRETLQGYIAKTANQIEKTALEIAKHQQECAAINQQIKMLIPNGLYNRADIYKGIRQQGILLTQQQLIFHKIDQLENEKDTLEDNLKHYQAGMNLLEKKNYKLSHYLQPLRRDYLRRCDNDEENDIQEMACYGRKNF